MSAVGNSVIEGDAAAPQRARTRRLLSASRYVVLAAVTSGALAMFCVAAGYGLARQADEQHAADQRATLRGAMSEFRAIFGRGNEVDPRFVRMVEQSAGLKDLQFSAEPVAGREMQPVLNAEGRIVGFVTWLADAPMTALIGRLLPLIAGISVALVGFAGFSLWQLRRSRAALASSEQRAAEALERDVLTGLPNQRKMSALLDAALAKGRDTPWTYALIELKATPAIVDIYGQHGADELVSLVGSRLRDHLRAGIVCGRVAACTFALLVQGESNADELLRDAIAVAAQPYWIDTAVHISACAGFARSPMDATTAIELTRRAELALQAAEKMAAGAVVAYEHAIDATASDQQFIRRELPRALKAQALDLHYQPIVAADGGRIVGVEALLRWTHKERGAISPVRFIPVAEQMGLMDSLGAFVLRRALQDAKSWPDLYTSVNLSPLQVRDRSIVDFVRETVQESGIIPSKVMLEITEGVLIENPDEMLTRIKELRALGVRIALDDFGSGYSSLNYLQRFPFDKLKIDRGFVSALGKSANAGVIVQAIVALGRALGVTVVVEGVETEEQRVLLRLAGCDEMQGFLFAKPAPATSILDLVTRAGKTAAA